jgi:hypothetical protein
VIYENQKDREQQSLAAFQLTRRLTSLGVPGVALRETPEHRRECYDFEMHVQGMWTGIVEVKCRKGTSDTAEKWGSLLVEVDRLKRLKKECGTHSRATGKWIWTKEMVWLWRMTQDNTCYAITMRNIVKYWNEFQDAPPEMMKDNHGNLSANKRGKLIPLEKMEVFQ